MSDPIRWRASDGGAPAGARELLRHASPPKALDAATRARHAAAIAKITAGAAPAAVAGSKLALGAKLLAGLGLAAAVAVGASPAVRARLLPHRPAAVAPAQRAASAPAAPTEGPSLPREAVEAPIATAPLAAPPPASPPAAALAAPTPRPAPAPRPRVVSAPAPSAPAPSAPVVAPPEAPVAPAPSGSLGVAGAPITAGSSALAPAEDPLEREGHLLQSAGDSVEADPQSALADLDRHQREFPSGQLAAERELLAVQALHNLGRNDEARARGEALIERYPRTPYASRTRHLLDALP